VAAAADKFGVKSAFEFKGANGTPGTGRVGNKADNGEVMAIFLFSIQSKIQTGGDEIRFQASERVLGFFWGWSAISVGQTLAGEWTMKATAAATSSG